MIEITITEHSTTVKATIRNLITYSDILPHGGINLFYTLKEKYGVLRKVTTEKIVIKYRPSDKRKSITCTINSTVKPPTIDKYKNIPSVKYVPDKLVTFVANGWYIDKSGHKKYITDRIKHERKVHRAETLLDLFYTGQIGLEEFSLKLNRVIDA